VDGGWWTVVVVVVVLVVVVVVVVVRSVVVDDGGGGVWQKDRECPSKEGGWGKEPLFFACGTVEACADRTFR
jgi:hypothetical protein